METVLLHHNSLCYRRFRPSSYHLSLIRRRQAANCSSSAAKRVRPPGNCFGLSFASTTTLTRKTVRRFEEDRKVSSDVVEEDGRPPFDINLAVVLAGFAFEAYNTPSDKTRTHEIDPYGCKTIFLSEEFVREIYDGQLLIKLKKGSQFPGLDLWGTSDPYITLRVGDAVIRSKTIWATTEPVWNENFKINVKNSNAQYLQVAAWDANIVTNDRRLGNAGINLESLSDGEEHDVRVDLEGLGGGGVVELEIQYQNFRDIDADKQGWKIPLLSDFLIGKGLQNAIKDTFGLEGLTARDFLISALGSSQQPSDDSKSESKNGSTGSVTEVNSELDNVSIVAEVKNGETKSENELAAKSIQNGSNMSGKIESLDLGEQGERQVTEADFLRSLGESIGRTLGGINMDTLEIPILHHVSWDGIDMIRSLGLESRKKADSEYVENGLAMATTKQSDAPPDESAAKSSNSSLEELQKASLDLLKQTEQLLGSWAVFTASLTGKKEKNEKFVGKTTAFIQENPSVAPQNQQLSSTIAPKDRFRSAEEMEELRKMFNKAESAMEAWAVLATSLGHHSFVKSSFEKICFLDNNKTDTQIAIWRDAEHHRLVVSFRGTEQVKWKDLRTDLMLLPAGFNPERVGGEFTEEAMIHSGFLNAYDSVRSKLMSLVRTLVGFSDDNADTPCQWHVYVTGHSLGGALATLFALELSASHLYRKGYIKVIMYNFGSPRVGNRKFAEQYNERVKDSWRVVNHRDIIPTVPRLLGYCHVAQPIYLTTGDIDDATVNMELVGDGYNVDIIGEATPDFLLEEFMKGEKRLIERLFQTEIAMLSSLRDGSALMQHMEDFYYISLLERVSPRFRPIEGGDKERLKA